MYHNNIFPHVYFYKCRCFYNLTYEWISESENLLLYLVDFILYILTLSLLIKGLMHIMNVILTVMKTKQKNNNSEEIVVASDEAGPAGGHVPTGNTKHLDSSSTQSPDRVVPVCSAPSLAPLEEQQQTVEEHSQSQGCSCRHQPRTTQQHVPPAALPVH